MARTYNLTGFRVEVTPTMEALGDQPFRCRVYPLRLEGGFFQGLTIVASSPASAAIDAVEEFGRLYPASPTCATCKHFGTFKVEDLDGFNKEAQVCCVEHRWKEVFPFCTCERHETL